MFLLNPTTSKIVKQDLIEHCCRTYQMDHRGYHGYSQWMRVPYNGRLLEKAKNANIKVVELF